MKKLIKYLKPYLLFAILAPILMLLEVSMDLFQPMFMQKIIDVGIANMDMNYVKKTLVIMFGVAILGFFGGAGCSIFSAIAAFNAGEDIRNDLFEKVQSLSFKNIDELETGNLITRLTNDVVQIQQIMLMGMRIMVRAPLQIIGSFIMVYIISPKLTIILAIIVPVVSFCIVYIIKKGYPLFMKVQGKLDQVNKVMQENLSGIRVVKAFVRKDYEEKRFGVANDNLTNISIKASKVVALITPIMMFLLNLGVIAVIWFGGIEVNDGNLQLGEVIAFINYLLQLLNALMMVARMSMMISKAEASASRIIEVLDTNPDIVDEKDVFDIDENNEDKEINETNKINENAGTSCTNGILEFHNVSFGYDEKGKEMVLKNINFTASPGQKVAILGSTGSGKTTLISLIPRLYDVDEGKITIGGKDIREMKIKTLRKNIGMVLQQTILFSGEIFDNICYGKSKASIEEVEEVANIVQADDFINNFENGYKTNLSQRGSNLSGGQKQRIAIARALITKPDILILDDSTSAVDVATEARIQKAIKSNFKNTIVLMVAQRINSVLDADKILVLDEGRIVAEGNHKELIKSSEVYKDIYKSQLGESSEDGEFCG